MLQASSAGFAPGRRHVLSWCDDGTESPVVAKTEVGAKSRRTMDGVCGTG